MMLSSVLLFSMKPLWLNFHNLLFVRCFITQSITILQNSLLIESPTAIPLYFSGLWMSKPLCMGVIMLDVHACGYFPEVKMTLNRCRSPCYSRGLDVLFIDLGFAHTLTSHSHDGLLNG